MGKTPILSHINKLGKTSRQNKKKEYLKKKQDQKNFTPTTEDNAIKRKKKQNK